MKRRVQFREPRGRKDPLDRSEPRDRNCTRAFGASSLSRLNLLVNTPGKRRPLRSRSLSVSLCHAERRFEITSQVVERLVVLWHREPLDRTVFDEARVAI